MKKRYFIGGTLAVALCVIVLCAFAANESADVPEAAATGQQTATTVSRSGGKVLVAYFSIPETDGVDGIGRQTARQYRICGHSHQ